ncbi:hypothetical protein [Cupriavidus basilensis]|uniref:hypothetical protein n=1 Tax=Cupriavidus basilensis TaxID=68895 RepID=UPI0039F70313
MANSATQAMQIFTTNNTGMRKMNNTTQNTATAEVVAPSILAVFDPIQAVITALEAKYAKTAHDVTTKEGFAAEKLDASELMRHRLDVEAKRVALKAPILKDGRDVDAIAKRLTATITKLEGEKNKRLDAELARQKAEARAAEEKERERLQAIKDAEIAKERAEAAERERVANEQAEALRRENEELAAKLAALTPATGAALDDLADIPEATFAPRGWAKVEADDEPIFMGGAAFAEEPRYPSDRAAFNMPTARRPVPKPAGQDADLLDLMDSTPEFKRNAAPVIPSADAIVKALSARAKRRTTLMHVCDVLEAISFLQGD